MSHVALDVGRQLRGHGGRCAVAALLCAGLVGCDDSPPGAPATASPQPERSLGIVLTASENGAAASPFEQVIETAFEQSLRAHVNAVQLRWQWREVETAVMSYEDMELDEANRLFAGTGVRIVLGIDPLDGPMRGTASDLDSVSFADPAMIARYEKLLDHVLWRLADLDVALLLVGNEVNVYLDEQGEWEPYATFYEAVGAHARAIAPVRVGVTGNGEIVTSLAYLAPMKALNRSSDVISLTEWVSTDPHAYFDVLAAEYEGRAISIQEIGFPSDPFFGSSEAKQADFVRDVFTAWDEHASTIEHVSFFYLHDMSAEQAQAWEDAVCGAIPEECADPGVIAAFFSSLGLRTYPGWGRDKEAFTVLMEESSARGW